MTEIDELNVIKNKEDENKKAIEDLKKSRENELSEAVRQCSEKFENTNYQIINKYNSDIESVKESEKKKLADAIDKTNAKSQVITLDLSLGEIEKYAYKILNKHIKE